MKMVEAKKDQKTIFKSGKIKGIVYFWSPFFVSKPILTMLMSLTVIQEDTMAQCKNDQIITFKMAGTNTCCVEKRKTNKRNCLICHESLYIL